MTEERWKLMRERFVEELNRPNKDGDDYEEYFKRVYLWLDAIEMSMEGEKLLKRIEAVEGVLRDDSPFGEPVDAGRILEALRCQ